MKKLKLQLKRNKGWALAGVLILSLVVTGYLFWGNRTSAADYMTVKVERGNLRNTVTATGTLQAVTTVQVGSQASGAISALYADFNSKVKKGQVIAQLDPAVTRAQVAQARANLQQAQAALQQARAAVAQSRAGVASSRAGVTDAQAKALAASSTTQNQQAGVLSAQANLAVLKAQLDDAASFLRQEDALLKGEVIPQREYDTAQTSLRTAQARYDQAAAQVQQAVLSQQSASGAGQAQAQAQISQTQAQVEQSQSQVGQTQAQVANAQAQVEQAQAALNLAEINQQHTTITSPIDGVVVSRDVSVGQTVAASLSAPTLFTIAQDLTQMQVIANIDQADIGLVEQAKSAGFTVDAFPGEEFKGAIQQVRLNPQNVQNVVTYNVVIDVANPEQKLKPGMTANLTITIDERNNVVKVPNAALRFTPQATTAGQSGQNSNAATGQGARRNAGQQGANANGANANNAVDGNAASDNGAQGASTRGGNFASPTAPVLAGQTRRVWVLGADGKPQPRRIKVGLSDGSSTEVVEGDLKEGEAVITGQTISATSKPSNSNAQSAPGFGGAPRGGAGGGGRAR
ncbi:MAG: HlyD family secretion protein [Acidobacteriota bacterium]|jgi:HlyD family secretion protein|nr:HlyD family secretion protein [Acidobacteriota bacterium]